MGNASVIWQGDANRINLQAFAICGAPARVLNVTGPETVSIRWLGERFGELLGATPRFTGTESGQALIANAAECQRLFGYPRVTLGEMIEWTAHWVKIGGRSLIEAHPLRDARREILIQEAATAAQRHSNHRYDDITCD